MAAGPCLDAITFRVLRQTFARLPSFEPLARMHLQFCKTLQTANELPARVAELVGRLFLLCTAPVQRIDGPLGFCSPSRAHFRALECEPQFLSQEVVLQRKLHQAPLRHESG